MIQQHIYSTILQFAKLLHQLDNHMTQHSFIEALGKEDGYYYYSYYSVGCECNLPCFLVTFPEDKFFKLMKYIESCQ